MEFRQLMLDMILFLCEVSDTDNLPDETKEDIFSLMQIARMGDKQALTVMKKRLESIVINYKGWSNHGQVEADTMALYLGRLNAETV